MEVQRVAVAEGEAHLPCVVAAIGLFHLDHIGAEIAEDRPGEGPGQHLSDLDHLHPGQRRRHHAAPGESPSAAACRTSKARLSAS